MGSMLSCSHKRLSVWGRFGPYSTLFDQFYLFKFLLLAYFKGNCLYFPGPFWFCGTWNLYADPSRWTENRNCKQTFLLHRDVERKRGAKSKNMSSKVLRDNLEGLWFIKIIQRLQKMLDSTWIDDWGAIYKLRWVHVYSLEDKTMMTKKASHFSKVKVKWPINALTSWPPVLVPGRKQWLSFRDPPSAECCSKQI